MKKELVKQLNQLFFEYITLYHQKVGFIFTLDDKSEPKCNKNQKKALFVIKKQNRIIQTELGKCMDLSKGALTTLLDSLEEVGFVIRVDDENDRRKKWIELTDDGMKYTNSKLKFYEEQLFNIVDETKEIEVLNAVENLKQIITFIEKL